jgi:hypothetical protein
MLSANHGARTPCQLPTQLSHGPLILSANSVGSASGGLPSVLLLCPSGPENPAGERHGLFFSRVELRRIASSWPSILEATQHTSKKASIPSLVFIN